MLAISQLFPTRFWWNFKCRFLGTSGTDSNCHGDICPGNICPGDICPYQEYLSCYWPDFYETLKVASWEHLEKILTVMVIFVQATFAQVTFVHIGISQLLLTRFWWNFKGRFLEHLEQNPSVRVTFVHATFVLATYVHIRNISAVTDPILMKLYREVPGNIYNRFQLSRWHLSRQHLLWWHLYISGISQLLLTQFGLNFKGKVKARSWQSQCKFMARSRRGLDKVKARSSRQGWEASSTTVIASMRIR